MAQLFGKNYQEAGSSSSPLLLRSNGEIKLQWGNKFIDLVKNGKINSEAKDCIFTVDTSDEIKANGIYLVTEDSSIWINVEGTKAKLSDNDTTYVSFLTANTNQFPTYILQVVNFAQMVSEEKKIKFIGFDD